jgi:gas vesicle protein
MGEREGGSGFLIGFIVGVIAGAAVGILYAPKAGKETRAMLKEKASELKEKAGDMFTRTARDGDKE